MRKISFLLALLLAPAVALGTVSERDKAELGAAGAQLLPNGGCEAGTYGWTRYVDAAGTSPVDGTGGSPTVTISATTTSPLGGAQSCVLTKPASNVQGQGWAYDFTVKKPGTVHEVTLDYTVVSGTYDAGSDSTDPDITAWVYGPTDGTPELKQLAPYKVLGVTIGATGKFQGRFQTAASGNAYRLILHEGKTGTSAYTFKVEARVSEQLRSYGPAISEWTTYTTTVSGLGTGSTSALSAQYRRIGDSMEVIITGVKDASAGTGSSAVTFTLPSGYTIDSNKTDLTDPGKTPLGIAHVYSIEASAQFEAALVIPATTTTVYIADPGTSNVYTGASFRASSEFGLRFTVPVTGWGGTVQMSNDGNLAPVIARYKISGAKSLTAGADNRIDYDSKDKDTHGAVTTGSGAWKFTAPRSDFYTICAAAVSATTSVQDLKLFKSTAGGAASFLAYIASLGSGAGMPSGCTGTPMDAGDYVYVALNNSAGTATSSNATQNWISITSGGSQQAGLNESVVASYTTSAMTSLSTTEAVIPYDDAIDTATYGSYDSSGGRTSSGSSWKWYPPSAGTYEITVNHLTTTITGSNCFVARVYKNGGSTPGKILHRAQGSNSGERISMHGSATVKLLATDYFQIKAGLCSGTLTLEGSRDANWIEIKRVGNY